jgi:hypothetical protein
MQIYIARTTRSNDLFRAGAYKQIERQVLQQERTAIICGRLSKPVVR